MVNQFLETVFCGTSLRLTSVAYREIDEKIHLIPLLHGQEG